MRYLGNKTKLLNQIETRVKKWWGLDPGIFFDVFAGSCSVAIHFRSLGWEVYANDLMAVSYVRQRAYISLDGIPSLPCSLEEMIEHLNLLEPRQGLIWRQFSGDGPYERLYFSGENAAKIDAIWTELVRCRKHDIDEDGFYLLLCLLIEAADRVANISGTYGAFLKKLNPNATKPLELRVPDTSFLSTPAGCAHREDAIELVKDFRVDVAYIDPPYNGRQYPKYYHVPEIIAEMHEAPDLVEYEAELYGKTGLRKFEDKLSAFCKKAEVLEAFRELVERIRADHVIISYNNEGLMSKDDITGALDSAGWDQNQFNEIPYKRFRSDSDDRRNYSGDSVKEWLISARRLRW